MPYNNYIFNSRSQRFSCFHRVLCFIFIFFLLWSILSWFFYEICILNCCCSVTAVSDFLWPHELQHVNLLCPSLSPWVSSNLCPLSQQCHETISSCNPLLLPSVFLSISHIRWAIYRFNTIPIKLRMVFFTELKQIISQFVWKNKNLK